MEVFNEQIITSGSFSATYQNLFNRKLPILGNHYEKLFLSAKNIEKQKMAVRLTNNEQKAKDDATITEQKMSGSIRGKNEDSNL